MGDGPPFFCFVCDLLILCIVLLCKMRVFIKKMAGFCGFFLIKGRVLWKKDVLGVLVCFSGGGMFVEVSGWVVVRNCVVGIGVGLC